MVKVPVPPRARIVRNLMTASLAIFGRTLTRRVVTKTVNTFGKLSAISTTDTTFTGDLQFGPDLDQKLITSGFIEVGEGVLYIKHDVTINLQDQIIDGNAVWEVVDRLEAPELEGQEIFFALKCRRMPNTSD